MSATLDALNREHINLARLLVVVEQQLDALERNKPVDYELIDLVLAYFQSYPDQFHHPKEDLVLAKMKERNPTTANTFDTLEAEHRLIADETTRFAELINLVEQDSQVPRAQVVETGRAFIALYRRHMSFEQEAFFPQATRTLSAEDWTYIDRHLEQPDDPLNAADAEAHYNRLADIIRG
jgi:hemerythrin-like domain-containing protein